MAPNPVPQSAFPDSKQHYAVLDGLRGVASVMVVVFHLFEPLFAALGVVTKQNILDN